MSRFRKKHPGQLSARRVALEVLCKWQGSGQPINPFVDQVLSTGSISLQDRQLAYNIINGVLRQQQYLDWVVARFSRHPVRKMKPRTLCALRIGIFQLLFLDRIPESAAVNETIKALKAVGQPAWLIRFANGVLRNIARGKNEIPPPDEARDRGRFLLNHPEWLVRRWEKKYGRKRTIALCRENNQPPPLTLRVNNRRIHPGELTDLLENRGIRVCSGQYAPNAVILKEYRGSISDIPGYGEGYFQVQDEAAQLASLLLPVHQGGRYLDGCAGLGGKTGYLGCRVKNGEVVAVEPDPRRLRLLRENMNRLGLGNIEVHNTTLERFALENRKMFDGVLLDAPCSGTGVIRRQPDIRWNRIPDDVDRYQQLQLQLLETAAGLVREDGALVYAVCSLEAEENEQVVEKFITLHPEFILENARNHLPETAMGLVNDRGFFQPTPLQGLDGFFSACFRRKKGNSLPTHVTS